jgi:hypothetical protein
LAHRHDTYFLLCSVGQNPVTGYIFT